MPDLEPRNVVGMAEYASRNAAGRGARMRHDRRDAAAAYTPARRPAASGWHPFLATVEVEVGTWVMTAPDGRRYAIVRLLQIGGERGYRCVTWAQRSEDRRLVGYFLTLRAAVEAGHEAYVRGHAPQGFAPSPWPSKG